MHCIQDHLSTTLLSLTLPISPTNWEDTLDTWLAVEHLCGEAESQKGQRILEMLFADDDVTEALGMALQLREIRTMTSGTPGDALPEGLMKRLKQGLGSHIKRHYYTYYKSIGMEQSSINRVVHYQAIGVNVINSIVMVSWSLTPSALCPALPAVVLGRMASFTYPSRLRTGDVCWAVPVLDDLLPRRKLRFRAHKVD